MLRRMLEAASVQAFLATTDRARALDFFQGVLGLAVLSEDDFAVVFKASSATLRVVVVEAFTPQPFTVFGWRVPDVPAVVRALTALGVQFERYPGMAQDDLGVWTAPGGGHVAWFKDPDGNTLSLSGMS